MKGDTQLKMYKKFYHGNPADPNKVSAFMERTAWTSLLNLDEARRDTCFKGVDFLLTLDDVVDIFLNGQN